MPGFHFVYSLSGGVLRDNITPSLNRLLHDGRYRSEVVYCDDRVFLGVTRYPEYPIAVFDNTDHWLLIEGRLYGANPPVIQKELSRLGDLLFGPDDCSGQIADWMTGHDGDYVIICRHKDSGRWALINDCLGRLPVYYRRRGGSIRLSRELRFIADQSPSPSMDRMALAQYLLLGFPVGERTLLEGVDRLPAGSMVRFGGEAADEMYRTIYRYNFESVQPMASPREAAKQLAACFTEACSRIADPEGNTVLSLSGGMDSRTVAAGLLMAGRRFRAVTYGHASGPETADVVYARETAAKLGFDWEAIPLTPSRGADVHMLLRMKGGMNSIGLAFYVSFLDEIGKRYGRDVIYLTGDGGDKTMPDLTPPRQISSSHRLVQFIIDRHDILPLDWTARLVGLPASDIVDQIESIVEAYPEQSFERKYVHFLIYERGMKWLFEGEDRNRCFVWSATPFYSRPFFQAAMDCPMKFKKRRALYREFLVCLSPTAAGIVDSNKGVPIISPAYNRKEAVFDLLARYPSMTRRLKNRLWPPGSYGLSSPAILCLKRQVGQSRAVGEYIDCSELMRLAASPAGLSRGVFDNLLTVTGAIELYSGAKESLDDFRDSEFL